MSILPPPVDVQPRYGELLGDATYWTPYVLRALEMARLPTGVIEAPFVGTFPTFLVGDLVVKLFGPLFEGPQCFAGEAAMHDLLARNADIPAPAVLARGALFDGDWPFLITERLRGAALRERAATPDVADALGRTIARVHALPAPDGVRPPERLNRLRAEAPERARRFGMPDHLAEQIPDYLANALSPGGTLIHSDLTNDHVFTRDGKLEGVIDWGDAMVADPYYEFVPVFIDALAFDRLLFAAFLDGYGWQPANDFARRFVQAVLSFEWGAIRRIGELLDLPSLATLEDLAQELFGAQ